MNDSNLNDLLAVEAKIMTTEYESSVACGRHKIESENILTCVDTGRVIAVFYNDYDLEEILNTIKEGEAAASSLEIIRMNGDS